LEAKSELDDPADRAHAGLFRGFILRNSDIGAATLTLAVLTCVPK
jgi:hypothetical protein